ncbi:MAG TPA: aspartyl protease family protein [Candidatus Acidoferrum sp.]
MRRIVRFFVFLFLNVGPASFTSRGQDPPVSSAATTTPGKPAKQLQSPAAPPTTLEVARQHYWNGDYKRATAVYTEIIASGNDVAAAYTGLARTCLKMRKVGEAYKAAAKALEFEPSLAAAHTALGDVYFRQGKLKEAEQEYLTPLRANKEEARAYFGLWRIYHATFEKKRAKTALDRAHALEPRDPDINGDWLETRPAAEQIRALEAFVASGGHGEHIGRAGARQLLVMLKDQQAHPGRTCQMAHKVRETKMTLEPIYSLSRGAVDRMSPGVGLDARLNKYSARLLVETSSDRIVLNQKTAQAAGVQQIVRTEMEGAGDENPPESYTAFLESIRIGEVELKGCYVTVIEDASPDNYLGDREGAIGVGIFANFMVDLDLPHSTLWLTELPPYPQSSAENAVAEGKGTDQVELHDRHIAVEMADWTPLYRSNQLLLLPVNVNEAKAKLFAISLGSSVSVISGGAASEVSTVKSDPFSRVRGLNGEVKNGQKTGELKLRFAGLAFDRKVLPVVDMSLYSENGFEVSGLLGFPLLRDFEIRIDYRDGLISFDSRFKRR